MKIQTAINKAFVELKKNDIKFPLLDCEILMSKALNKNREFIVLNLDQELKKEKYFYFQELIKERSRGKPVAYITGKKHFWKDEFYVNENVLIPRPDTEIIIEQVLEIFKNRSNITFLEIGVGSGCILLSILKEKKNF
tara:strand:- start:918 stop:1331 length:414 start_codon:yes stop_codon:yes gene_type:complete